MFDLGLDKKSQSVRVQGKDITLFEPSALARTRYLEQVMARAEAAGDLPKGAAVADAPGHVVMRLRHLDLQEGVEVIAMCLHADPACQATQEEIRAYLERHLNEESLDKLYLAAQALAFPAPPKGEGIDDPKAAPAGALPTNSPES